MSVYDLVDNDPEFDLVIGKLDFILSKLMGYAKDAEKDVLSDANRQTLKHHAEDMEAAAKAIYKRLGVKQEGTPQPGGLSKDAKEWLEMDNVLLQSLELGKKNQELLSKTLDAISRKPDPFKTEPFDPKPWEEFGRKQAEAEEKEILRTVFQEPNPGLKPDTWKPTQEELDRLEKDRQLTETKPQHEAKALPKYTPGSEEKRRNMPPHILKEIDDSKRRFFNRLGIPFPGEEFLSPTTLFSFQERVDAVRTQTVPLQPDVPAPVRPDAGLERQPGDPQDGGRAAPVRTGELPSGSEGVQRQQQGSGVSASSDPDTPGGPPTEWDLKSRPVIHIDPAARAAAWSAYGYVQSGKFTEVPADRVRCCSCRKLIRECDCAKPTLVYLEPDPV